MNFQCPKCLWIHQFNPGDRLPPWCGKCGNDLKPDDYLPVAQQPAAERPADEGVTTVTGTGPKPWLGPVVEASTPQPHPLPATDPNAEAGYAFAKAGGLLLLAIAAVWAGNVWTFAKSAGRAEGRVEISNDYFDAYKLRQTPQTEPVAVVRYVVAGKRHEFVAPNLTAGTTVEVLYPQDEPHRGELGDAMTLYRWPALVGLVGFGMLAGSIVASNSLANRRARAFDNSRSR
jgi:hypothetical protein